MRELFIMRDNYMKEVQRLATKIASLEHRINGLKRAGNKDKEVESEIAEIKELKKKRDLYKFYIDKINLFIDTANKYRIGAIPEDIYLRELAEIQKYFPDITPEKPLPNPQNLEVNIGVDDLVGE